MDPFEEGFKAGFSRGCAFGTRLVIDSVQRTLPQRDSPHLGSVDSGNLDRALRECLLEREARRRSQADAYAYDDD